MADSARTAFYRARGRLWRGKSFTSRQVTAIDVDGQTLCVVQAVHRGGNTSVTRLATAELEANIDPGRSEPKAMGGILAGALKKLNLKPGALVMGIPRALVVLRTLTLPATDNPREMASMVHFQIAKDLPFKTDEAVIDFKVQGPASPAATTEPEPAGPDKPAGNGSTSSQPRVEVLVAAVKREVVERYQQGLAAVGLNLIALGLRSYANARCVEACRIAPPDKPVALVSLRPDEVIIDVVVGRSLVFSRVAAVKTPGDAGAEPAAAAEDSHADTAAHPAPNSEAFVNAVVIEVVRTLHSYTGMERQSGVTKVAVSGDTGEEGAVVAGLSRRISAPCELLNPARALGLDLDEGEKVSGATAAMGLGLGVNDPEGLPFDFLNPKRPAVHRDLRRVKMLAGVILALALLFSLFGIRSHLVTQRAAVLDDIREQAALEERNRTAFRLMQLQARAVEEWVGDRRNWLDHYAYLSAILPPSTDLYVTSFTTTANGAIRLGVQARSAELLSRLDRELRAAGYDVKPLAINPATDSHGYSFRSNVDLRPSNRLEIDLTTLQPPPRPEDDISLRTAASPRAAAEPVASEESAAQRPQFRRRAP